MADLGKLAVYIGQLDDGRWLAATSTAPYFCFEAASEKEVKSIVRDALKFFNSALDKFNGALPNPAFEVRERVPFNVKSRVQADELLAAA